MRAGLLEVGLIGFLGAFGAGCGNVCDDAADICSDGAPASGGSSDDAGEPECVGAVECQAQCVVDADSCDLTDEALVKCYAACN